MKNILLIIAIFIISLSSVEAQPKKMTDELKKIRKEKYLENVSVDNATADKYFEVYDENSAAILVLMNQKKDNMEYLEKNSDAADVTTKLDEIFEIDTKILEKKKEFYSLIKAFLPPKQLAQSVVFQTKFNKELKKQIDIRKEEK